MDIEHINTLEVVRNRRGVLYLAEEPHFIVEHKMHSNTGGVDYVACYEVDKALYEKSKCTIIDKTKTLVQKPRYSEKSLLGQIGNKRLEQQGKKNIYTYKPAIFVSTVEQGTSFITDEPGLGFKEYSPDKINLIDGKLEQGEPTGVFILLDDIEWEESTIDLNALSQSITRQGGDWHDL